MSTVPEDFPCLCVAGVAGIQPKIAGRMLRGHFIEGMTDEEILTRYEACQDLAEQLVVYAKRKRVELPELPLTELLRRLRAGIVKKRWDINAEELVWVLGRVAVAMGGGAADAPGWPAMEVGAHFLKDAEGAQSAEAVVDRALARRSSTASDQDG